MVIDLRTLKHRRCFFCQDRIKPKDFLYQCKKEDREQDFIKLWNNQYIQLLCCICLKPITLRLISTEYAFYEEISRVYWSWTKEGLKRFEEIKKRD